MKPIKIVIYTTTGGKKPFVDWLEKLDKGVRSIIKTRMDRIHLWNFGDCKTIKGGQGIRELRIDTGPGYRIYFGITDTTIVVILAGGDKKSQTRDITKATEYWLEYKESLL